MGGVTHSLPSKNKKHLDLSSALQLYRVRARLLVLDAPLSLEMDENAHSSDANQIPAMKAEQIRPVARRHFRRRDVFLLW